MVVVKSESSHTPQSWFPCPHSVFLCDTRQWTNQSLWSLVTDVQVYHECLGELWNINECNFEFWKKK